MIIMQHFSSLLPHILKSIPTETLVRDFIMKQVQEKLNITLKRKEIQLKKNILCLEISPIIKSRLIHLYPEIQIELNEFLQEKKVQLTIKKII